MKSKEEVQKLVDAVGDITLEACGMCPYMGSEDFYEEQAAGCRGCHVKKMSNEAFELAAELDVYWSPLRYQTRKGAPWPGMPDGGDA